MLNFNHQTRVFLFVVPVDMRKSFRGPCQLVESELGRDPNCGDWFVFINKRRDRMKLLGRDGQGFWVWYKQLEKDVFQLPKHDDALSNLEIDATQLSLIISRIESCKYR